MAGETEAGQFGQLTAPTAATADPWATLQTSADAAEVAAAWLELQSSILGEGVLRGVVVLGTPETGPFAPVAVWPQNTLGSPALVATIDAAIAKRETVTARGKIPRTENSARLKIDVVAFPLLVEKQVCGAVGVELEQCSADKLQIIVSQLHWGSAWLEALIRRNRYTSADRLVTVLDLLATALHHERFQAAATAVSTELAGALVCDRVSIGFSKGQHNRVAAVSHSASFAKKANIVRAIEACMDEALDQQATIVFPADDDGPLQVTRAHETLAGMHDRALLCTVPLAAGEQLLGALTLERSAGQGFDEKTVQLCEHVGALVGPLLDVKRKDDRWLIQKAGDSVREYARKLAGPRHVALKLASFSVLAVLLFFSFVHGDYRVTADARLEGAVQRAISVPLAGYVAEAGYRAGDIVREGDVLFALDDRDLWLERLKWGSQKSQYTREYNEAVAKRERAQAAILTAQIEQADAQIALIEEQLQRIKVTAPFDSYIVSGDLSQSLGAPVERGDILFEVAPLDAYRVILNVEERDIREISVGQTGTLVVAGAPRDRLPIAVDKITPVATAEEGKNVFRVEARFVDADTAQLRPGMEGVAKVEIDSRRLIWIWTHKITYWMRMFFWSWWP